MACNIPLLKTLQYLARQPPEEYGDLPQKVQLF